MTQPVILTCSMARDRELFAILARSIDALVDETIRHDVIVPRADLAAFRAFQTPRRRIIAQEDVLPLRLWKTPGFLTHFSFLSSALRRPVYITPQLKALRGWMLQQLLKIEYSRCSEATEILHVDSDVFFCRPTAPADLLAAGGAPILFRAHGDLGSEDHRRWIATAERLLGIQNVPHDRHYVENCVPWSPNAARALCAHIETTHGRPWHQMIAAEPSVSEYYLYGIFVDRLGGDFGLSATDQPLCCSLWSASGAETDLAADIAAQLTPAHLAIGIQSTVPISTQTRAALAAPYLSD